MVFDNPFINYRLRFTFCKKGYDTMTRYLIRRLLQLVPVLLLISVIVFVLLQMMPGDPAAQLEDNPNITAEDRARFEERSGLNDPIHVKYLKWLLKLGMRTWMTWI